MQAANFNNINLCNCQSTQLVVEQLLAENALLKSRIEWFNRHVYGQKQERFVAPEDSAQLCLQFGDEVIEVAPEDAKQIIAAHERIKQNKENAHKGRLPIPASLPRVDEVIEPEEDTSEMTRIGEDVTEILEITPERIWVRRIIRPRYARNAAAQQEAEAKAEAAGDPTPDKSYKHRCLQWHFPV